MHLKKNNMRADDKPPLSISLDPRELFHIILPLKHISRRKHEAYWKWKEQKKKLGKPFGEKKKDVNQNA